MEINGKAEDIRQRVLKERDAAKGRRFRFSDQLKNDILAGVQSSGRSHEAFCQSIALSVSTLSRWQSASRKSGEERPGGAVSSAPKKHSRLKRVTVSPEPSEPTSFTLRFPSGAELYGFTLEQMRELLGLTR